jgi:UDP-glucuronate decarboxylase
MNPHHESAGRPVLVTGAAGFVGSHLCERLIERGETVIAIDNLSTGEPSHLAALQGHPRFAFERHDIVDPLPHALHDVGAIYNLACPASPAYYQRHPVATLLASTLGTWRLLELAARRAARLLQASTSEVYGDPQIHPQHEDYWGHVNPIGPRACYDEGKRCAEAMCYAYARDRGVTVRVARLFNTYGERLRPGDGRVVSNFIVQALAGTPLTVHGDGLQTRSFCHVSDTVRALIALMRSDWSAPVNIGNPREHTVLELARRVLEITGSRSTLAFESRPIDDPARRCPDISTARRVLRWQPEVPLDDGLRRTIAHFWRLRGATTAFVHEAA